MVAKANQLGQIVQKMQKLTIIFSKRSMISFSERFMERSSKRGWGMGSSDWVERGSVGCWMRGFSFFMPAFLKLVMRSRWKERRVSDEFPNTADGLSSEQHCTAWVQAFMLKQTHSWNVFDKMSKNIQLSFVLPWLPEDWLTIWSWLFSDLFSAVILTRKCETSNLSPMMLIKVPMFHLGQKQSRCCFATLIMIHT